MDRIWVEDGEKENKRNECYCHLEAGKKRIQIQNTNE